MHRCVPLVLHILVAVFCILCGFYPCLTEIKSFIHHSFIHSFIHSRFHPVTEGAESDDNDLHLKRVPKPQPVNE